MAATQTKNYTHVLPTFLPAPDGREVDVQFWFDPRELPSYANPCGSPAEVTLWDVVTVDGRSVLAALAPEQQGALAAECLADALAYEGRRVR